MDEPDTDTAVLRTRQMALRAIMDGRGAEVVVLRDPALVAHYGGAGLPGGTVLLVTATEVRAVGDGAQAAGALDRGERVVGHDGSGGLGAGEALDLGAVIRRQAAG
ncbi:hypothetical protein [Paracoccus sanguinis]|uniref:Uncharacterized protein n=1 Tax=Paracoccus sanguinis TaxID=1545044 RepID=A0A1H2Y764_9RHOB|nr:hypothetical protein [Paracoccus sanguinis]KGJ17233.1 hypothetical protein IX57_09025 [Paracoccus sanguinis]SDX00901.1 hypothetical protein SAMN05444276_102755 [Paracoccus sanguinis]